MLDNADYFELGLFITISHDLFLVLDIGILTLLLLFLCLAVESISDVSGILVKSGVYEIGSRGTIFEIFESIFSFSLYFRLLRLRLVKRVDGLAPFEIR